MTLIDVLGGVVWGFFQTLFYDFEDDKRNLEESRSSVNDNTYIQNEENDENEAGSDHSDVEEGLTEPAQPPLELAREIRSLIKLSKDPNGIMLRYFYKVYKRCYRKRLLPSEHGFSNLRVLLDKTPGVEFRTVGYSYFESHVALSSTSVEPAGPKRSDQNRRTMGSTISTQRSSAQAPLDLARQIRLLLKSTRDHNGILISNFGNLYFQIHAKRLLPSEHGFSNLRVLLENTPGVELKTDGYFVSPSRVALSPTFVEPAIPKRSESTQRSAVPQQSSSPSSNLPPGWSEAFDRNGRVYYRNHVARTTHWKKPVAEAADQQAAQSKIEELLRENRTLRRKNGALNSDLANANELTAKLERSRKRQRSRVAKLRTKSQVSERRIAEVTTAYTDQKSLVDVILRDLNGQACGRKANLPQDICTTTAVARTCMSLLERVALSPSVKDHKKLRKDVISANKHVLKGFGHQIPRHKQLNDEQITALCNFFELHDNQVTEEEKQQFLRNSLATPVTPGLPADIDKGEICLKHVATHVPAITQGLNRTLQPLGFHDHNPTERTHQISLNPYLSADQYIGVLIHEIFHLYGASAAHSARALCGRHYAESPNAYRQEICRRLSEGLTTLLSRQVYKAENIDYTSDHVYQHEIAWVQDKLKLQKPGQFEVVTRAWLGCDDSELCKVLEPLFLELPGSSNSNNNGSNLLSGNAAGQAQAQAGSSESSMNASPMPIGSHNHHRDHQPNNLSGPSDTQRRPRHVTDRDRQPDVAGQNTFPAPWDERKSRENADSSNASRISSRQHSAQSSRGKRKPSRSLSPEREQPESAGPPASSSRKRRKRKPAYSAFDPPSSSSDLEVDWDVSANQLHRERDERDQQAPRQQRVAARARVKRTRELEHEENSESLFESKDKGSKSATNDDSNKKRRTWW